MTLCAFLGNVIFEKVKHVFILERDVKFSQQGKIFAFERTLLMMDFLIADVDNDRVQLRMSVGKRAKAFLLGKLPFDPVIVIDEF